MASPVLRPTQEDDVLANTKSLDNTPSRKRQHDDDDDSDNNDGNDSDNADEPRTKRARPATVTPRAPAQLTRKNLALFNDMGKKNTADDARSARTTGTSSTSTGFAIQARKNGILDPESSRPPYNLDELRQRLAQSRATASPPASAYDDYVDQV